MGNVDSVANDLGLLLVSGLLLSASLDMQRKVHRVTPGNGNSQPLSRNSADMTEAINLARSRLEEVPNIPNKTDAFIPPQAQARCVELKKIAQVLQDNLFRSSGAAGATPRTMKDGVAAVIDTEFAPTMHSLFAECVEDGRQLVPDMRAQYHRVRRP